MINRLSAWLARNRPDLYAILDIGTCDAKALLILVDGEQAAIIGVGKQPHAAGAIENGSLNDTRLACQACEAALSEAEAQSEAEVGEKMVADRVVVGLNGPMLKSASLTFSTHRPQPRTRLTEAELRAIVQRAERLLLQQAREIMGREMVGQDIEIGLVDAEIQRILIDGYAVSNAVGVTGENVDVRLSNTFAPAAYLAAAGSIATALEMEPVAIRAGACSVTHLPYIAGRGDAIVIDAGGQSTDIVLARHGGIESIASVPLGGVALTRRVARTLGVPPAAGEDLKKSYAAAGLDQARMAELGSALAGDVQAWVDALVDALGAMAGKEDLPASIYLSGGAAMLPDLEHCLRAQPWLRLLPFEHPPQVTLLQPRVAALTDSTRRASDPSFVAAVALAAWIVQATRTRAANTPQRLLNHVLTGMGLS